MRETRVQSLGWDDPLEKEMATHSSTLAWKNLWTEEPGRLQSHGVARVRHDWATSLSLSLDIISTSPELTSFRHFSRAGCSSPPCQLDTLLLSMKWKAHTWMEAPKAWERNSTCLFGEPCLAHTRHSGNTWWISRNWDLLKETQLVHNETWALRFEPSWYYFWNHTLNQHPNLPLTTQVEI